MIEPVSTHAAHGEVDEARRTMKALASIPEVHRAALTRDGLADATTTFRVIVQTVAERV